MKWLVYIITLLASVATHVMRMGLPFVQLQIMQHFQVSSFQIGLSNALLYIIIGLSCLKQVFTPTEQKQFTYLWGMCLSALYYLLIPIFMCSSFNQSWLLFACMVGFGWGQGVVWPVLLGLISSWFSPTKDGCLLGFWASNSSIGNIIGFLVCTILVFNLQLPFESPLIFGGFLSLITTFAIYMLPYNLELPIEKKQNQLPLSFELFKQILFTKQAFYLCINVCMLKSILYGVLLWLPMYFNKQGFGAFQGYILIAINISGVLGSILLGYTYEKVTKTITKTLVNIVTIAMSAISFFFIKQIQFTVQNRLVLMAVSSMIGFCIMGSLNIILTHQVSFISRKKSLNLSALSSMLLSFGNIWAGIVQIVIGRFASDSSQSIFLIFSIMTVVVLALQIIRGVIEYLRDQNQQNSSQKQQTQL